MQINFKIKNKHHTEELQKAVKNGNIHNTRLSSEDTGNTHAVKTADKSNGSI